MNPQFHAYLAFSFVRASPSSRRGKNQRRSIKEIDIEVREEEQDTEQETRTKTKNIKEGRTTKLELFFFWKNIYLENRESSSLRVVGCMRPRREKKNFRISSHNKTSQHFVSAIHVNHLSTGVAFHYSIHKGLITHNCTGQFSFTNRPTRRSTIHMCVDSTVISQNNYRFRWKKVAIS